MGKALKKYFPEDVGPEEELSNDGNEPRPEKRTYDEGRIQQYSVNVLKKYISLGLKRDNSTVLLRKSRNFSARNTFLSKANITLFTVKSNSFYC